MRILRVAPWLYPDTKGGGQYHVHALSRDQAAMGHDVTVLTIRQDGSLPQVEEREGYTVVRYDAIARPLGNAVSPGLARYLASADEFDVIHAHSHYYLSTNLAALKRRLGDIPLAITNHGLYSQSAPERVFRWYLKTLGRWTFDQADVVFCYTETDEERVRDLGVSSRIEVVPNGIDTERFTPEGPESDLVQSDGPVVLFVGRLVEGKRPGIAVEAFAEVLEEYPDAELYLAGDGPLGGELEKQVRELGIGQSVTFLGHLAYDEMPAVYRSGDVLVLPSRAEGVPRTVLEAMASGVPFFISDLPQMESFGMDGGRLISDGDSSAFANNVTEALNDSSYLDSIATAARERVVTEHQWKDTVMKTTEILSNVHQG